jgi:multidrug efflux pump subunit AcrB
MWIVRIALKRPYTFVVLALLILLVGPLTIARTPTDIFPNIDIPVVTVVWNYGGLSADEMSNRIVSIFERNLTATVNDIEHVESQSLRGIAVTEGSLSDPRLPAGLFPTATQLHRQRILKDEIMWS